MIQSAALFLEPKALDVSDLGRRNETSPRENFDRVFDRETERLSESRVAERTSKRTVEGSQDIEAPVSSSQVDPDGSKLQDDARSGDFQSETGQETRPTVDRASGEESKVEVSVNQDASKPAVGAVKVLLQTTVEGSATANKLQAEGMGVLGQDGTVDTKSRPQHTIEQGFSKEGLSIKPEVQQNGKALELSGQQGDGEEEVVRSEHLRQATKAKANQGQSSNEVLKQTKGELTIKSSESNDKGPVQIKVAESNPVLSAKTNPVEGFSVEGRDVETNSSRQDSSFDQSREQMIKQVVMPHRQAVSEDDGESTINRNQQDVKSDVVRVEPGVVGSAKPVVMEKGAAAIEKLAEVQVERAQRQEIESSVERVVKAAKVTLARGSSRIQIQLDPPELGRLLVDIRRSATGIHLELHASTVKAQQLLEKNSGELRAALESQGITANQIDVHLKTDLRNETFLDHSQESLQDQPEDGDGDQSHENGESEEPGDDAFGSDTGEVEGEETGVSMDESSEMGHEGQVVQAGRVDVRV